jgi:serine/threonine protein kinase
MNHPHILKLYHFFEDETYIYLILELAENGNLFQYIRKKKRLSEPEAFVYFFQTCLAIDYMHKREIIHWDIKVFSLIFQLQPENILLDSKSNIKIGDFGWSTDINGKRDTFCGTLEYLSPEMMKNQ